MTVDRLKFWVANDEQYCDRDLLTTLGWHLYNIVFDPERSKDGTAGVKESFEATYKAFLAQSRNNADLRLRLSLIFHKGAEELASYPWEFLYKPDSPRGFFFAGERTNLILTRFVPESPQVSRLDPEDEALRILVVLSSPRDLDSIDAQDIINSITRLQQPQAIEVQYLENPSFNELRSCVSGMNGFRPHILHFIGHGEEGKIALMREKEDIEEQELQNETWKALNEPLKKIEYHRWYESETVRDIFDKHKPRLVFLHACKGAAPLSLNSFNSTARELVYSEIPAVVAMQYEIRNEDASRFAETFYREIGEGRAIDEAVSLARRELGTSVTPRRVATWNDRGFGTPVVYLQSREAIISRIKARPGAQVTNQGQFQQSKVPCPNRDCRDGLVSLDDKFCMKCYHQLVPCPDCGKQISAQLNMCAKCGYGLRQVGTSPGAQSPADLTGVPVVAAPDSARA